MFQIAGQVCLSGILFLYACAPPPVQVDQLLTSSAVTNTSPATSTETSNPTRQAPPTPTASITSTHPLPTETPAAHAVPSPTLTAIPTNTPSLTAEWTVTSRPSTAEPSATKTLSPTRTATATVRPRIPLADVLITRPGHLSRLTSPFTLESSVIPSPGGTVRVELLGEDGRLLIRHLIQYSSIQDYRLPLRLELEYDIPGVAETARLQIIVQNAQDEIVYVNSVDVILLSLGETERNPSGDTLEPFFLQRPWGQQLIQGGVMKISGYLRPLNEQPIIFELYTDAGELAASKQLTPEEVINGQHYPFEMELAYTTPKATWARLIVRQAGERIPGDAILNSVQVWLKP